MKQKRFFFEKKKQKTFLYLDMGGFTCSDQIKTSFLLLFFKKEALPCFHRQGGNDPPIRRLESRHQTPTPPHGRRAA
jgi:hypothetical protein